MSKPITLAAQEITAQVLPAEAGLDHALANAAALVHQMSLARAETGCSFARAHAPMAQGVRLMISLLSARLVMVRLHGELAGTAAALDPVAFGDLHEDCDDVVKGSDRPHLAAVA